MSEEGFTLPAPARRVLEGLVPVICPPEAVELGVVSDIVDHVGLTLGALAPLFRAGFVAGLITYDLSSVAWLPARGRRSHKLPRELAERWFRTWLDSNNPAFHQLAFAMKQLTSLAHYEHPAVQEKMGYRPQQWIEKVTKRRLEVYSDEIQRHEASILAPDPLRRGASVPGTASAPATVTDLPARPAKKSKMEVA
jgi:hypothetical protein